MKKGINLLAEHKKDIAQHYQDVNEKVFNGPHQCNLPEESAIDKKSREEYILANQSALNDIQKLLYGKANLAEILVRSKQIEKLMPKINKMMKDIEYQASQVDLMKADANDFVKGPEIQNILNVVKKDQIIYTDIQVKENRKEINIYVDDKLKCLDQVPHSSDYVKRQDFLMFQEDFSNIKDAVERVTDVLLMGYKTESNHVLKGKVDRTEVEDMIKKKFDYDRGKDLEKNERKFEKKLTQIETRQETIEKTIVTVVEKVNNPVYDSAAQSNQSPQKQAEEVKPIEIPVPPIQKQITVTEEDEEDDVSMKSDDDQGTKSDKDGQQNMQPNFYNLSSSKIVPDMRTKKGQAQVLDIIQQLCGFALDSKETQAVQQSEIEGLKEKLLDMTQSYKQDKESIRTSLSAFKQQEAKISEVVQRTNKVMKIVDDFSAFQERVDFAIIDISKKSKNTSNESVSRLNLLDDLQIKFDKRLLTLERASTVTQQDLASHKLSKRKQIDDIQEKTWQLHDFKNELQRQMDNVLEHTFNVSENVNEKVDSVKNQLNSVKQPLIHQISNLISQNELLQTEVQRSQQINRELIQDCIKYVQTGNAGNFIDQEIRPREINTYDNSAQSLGLGSMVRRSKLKSEIGGRSHKSNASIMAINKDKLNSMNHSGKQTTSVLSQRRMSSGGPSQRQEEVSNSLNEAGAIMTMLDNTDLTKTLQPNRNEQSPVLLNKQGLRKEAGTNAHSGVKSLKTIDQPSQPSLKMHKGIQSASSGGKKSGLVMQTGGASDYMMDQKVNPTTSELYEGGRNGKSSVTSKINGSNQKWRSSNLISLNHNSRMNSGAKRMEQKGKMPSLSRQEGLNSSQNSKQTVLTNQRRCLNIAAQSGGTQNYESSKQPNETRSMMNNTTQNMTNNAFSMSFKEENMMVTDEAPLSNLKGSSKIVLSLDEQLKQNERYIKSRMKDGVRAPPETVVKGKSFLSPNESGRNGMMLNGNSFNHNINYLSGGLQGVPTGIGQSVSSGPLFQALSEKKEIRKLPLKNQSQVQVKDYLNSMSNQIAGPVLMNIQSIVMTPQQVSSPISNGRGQRKIGMNIRGASRFSRRGQNLRSKDGAVTTQMSMISDKKTTEQLARNDDLPEDGDNTLDLKRFDDIFSSNGNAATTAGGLQMDQKIRDHSSQNEQHPEPYSTGLMLSPIQAQPTEDSIEKSLRR